MADNFPGPYQLRVFYNCAPSGSPNLTHVMALNLAVSGTPEIGTPFADIDIIRRIGGVVDLATVTSELHGVLRPILSLADTLITHAELWKYAEGTHDASYVATYVIDLSGLNVNVAKPAGQMIWSWRTGEGGIMKIYVMEATNQESTQQSYGNLDADEQAFVDWFHEDATSYALARDTSPPLVFLRMSPGQHETIFQKRYRP